MRPLLEELILLPLDLFRRVLDEAQRDGRGTSLAVAAYIRLWEPNLDPDQLLARATPLKKVEAPEVEFFLDFALRHDLPALREVCVECAAKNWRKLLSRRDDDDPARVFLSKDADKPAVVVPF